MTKTDYRDIVSLLKTSSNIIITSHHNPDGDAVGSAMAMYHVLRKSDKNITVILPNRFPDFLRWIEGSEQVVIFDQQDEKEMEKLFSKAGMVFCLDYNSPSRVDKMEKHIRETPAAKILIDHHPNPDTDAFDYVLSETSASSTAELVHKFVVNAGMRENIDKPAAECLYTGIVTDTGSFSFACNNAETYRITAELISLGVDAEKLHRLIYDTFSESRLRLMGYAFAEKLVVLPEFHTAIISLSRKELNEYNYKTGDTEGLVNYPLSIKEINVSIMMTEREDLIRLSFRSKGNFAVNRIAKEHFEGGGHKNAAGGNSHHTMEETMEKIKSVLPLYKDELDYVIE